MEETSSFPPPPVYYKKGLKVPPKYPTEGEFSMFGVSYTVSFIQTQETPLIIEAPGIQELFDTQNPVKCDLYKLQFSLLNKTRTILQCLSENPLQALSQVKDYEQIILNFYQLIYQIKNLQGVEELKTLLKDQILLKEEKIEQHINSLQILKESLSSN